MARTGAPVVATYNLVGRVPIEEAAHALAIGQSIGNPFLPLRRRINLKPYTATVVALEPQVKVAYPLTLFGDTLNVSHLLSVLMGGQMDIGQVIAECHLTYVDYGGLYPQFPRPRYGTSGIRYYLGTRPQDPLLGAIIKPKVGLTPKEEAAVVVEMALGGADVIKEDEILSPYNAQSRLADRVQVVTKALRRLKRKVVFVPCATSDDTVAMALRFTLDHQGIFPHFNTWVGPGAYYAFRQTATTAGLFYQRSGYQVMTGQGGPFSIADTVWYELLYLLGCDIAQVGMTGGYHDEDHPTLSRRIIAMKGTLPSFSCGVTPENAHKIARTFGPDVLVTSGGWVAAHPKGVRQACRELRQALSSATD